MAALAGGQSAAAGTGLPRENVAEGRFLGEGGEVWCEMGFEGGCADRSAGGPDLEIWWVEWLSGCGGGCGCGT